MALLAPILLFGVAHLPTTAVSVPDRAPIARLEDGTRIRCEQADPGAESFETQWGVFHCPGNPVVAVVDGDAEWKVLESLREYDYDAYLAEASRRGFLEPLLDAAKLTGKKAEAFNQQAVFEALETWGPYFDPVPRKLDAQERVDYLWNKLEKGKPGEVALLTGRLMAEFGGSLQRTDLKVSLADLRRGLRDKNPAMRRAAALVSAQIEERQALSPLLKTAVTDKSTVVRAACAQAAVQLDHGLALSSFSSKLWHGRSTDERIAAAEHLGNHGDALSIDVLMVPLFTATTSGGGAQSTAFFGRQVTAITDFDVEVAQAASISDPRVSVLQEGVSLQVRVVSVRLVRTVMGSLRKLTRANPGPQPKDWLKWHAAR